MPRMVDNLPGIEASSELAAVRNQTSVTSRFGLNSSNLSPKTFVVVGLGYGLTTLPLVAS